MYVEEPSGTSARGRAVPALAGSAVGEVLCGDSQWVPRTWPRAVCGFHALLWTSSALLLQLKLTLVLGAEQLL